jgi:hypothetical protein
MSSLKRIAFRERALIWAMRTGPGKAMPERRPAGNPKRIRRPSRRQRRQMGLPFGRRDGRHCRLEWESQDLSPAEAAPARA